MVVVFQACSSLEEPPATVQPVELGSGSYEAASGTFLNANDLTVVDGDTVHYGQESIRLLGLDAPEGPSPYFIGDQGEPALRAKNRLKDLIAAAKSIQVFRLPEPDPHGRTLAYLLADGTNLSAVLVGQGLALENVGHYGDQGFPDLAQQVTDAAGISPQIDFEPPHLWRRNNRKEN